MGLVRGQGYRLVAPVEPLSAGRNNAAPAPAVARTSLAVLPLASFSDEPGQSWFAASMHDSLITDIVRGGKLAVIPRTSATACGCANRTVPQIAQELGDVPPV